MATLGMERSWSAHSNHDEAAYRPSARKSSAPWESDETMQQVPKMPDGYVGWTSAEKAAYSEVWPTFHNSQQSSNNSGGVAPNEPHHRPASAASSHHQDRYRHDSVASSQVDRIKRWNSSHSTLSSSQHNNNDKTRQTLVQVATHYIDPVIPQPFRSAPTKLPSFVAQQPSHSPDLRGPRSVSIALSPRPNYISSPQLNQMAMPGTMSSRRDDTNRFQQDDYQRRPSLPHSTYSNVSSRQMSIQEHGSNNPTDRSRSFSLARQPYLPEDGEPTQQQQQQWAGRKGSYPGPQTPGIGLGLSGSPHHSPTPSPGYLNPSVNGSHSAHPSPSYRSSTATAPTGHYLNPDAQQVSPGYPSPSYLSSGQPSPALTNPDQHNPDLQPASYGPPPLEGEARDPNYWPKPNRAPSAQDWRRREETDNTTCTSPTAAAAATDAGTGKKSGGAFGARLKRGLRGMFKREPYDPQDSVPMPHPDSIYD